LANDLRHADQQVRSAVRLKRIPCPSTRPGA
jgi:hypothetical protein